MSKSTPIEETDRLLNDLEDLAASSASNAVFFDRLLTSLQLLVSSQSAAILLSISPNQFGIISKVGNLPPDAIQRWESMRSHQAPDHFCLNDTITVPIQSESSDSGCLYVGFAKPLPESARQGLIPIVEAFAEILQVRQIHRIEKLVHEHWALASVLMNQLMGTHSREQAAGLLADRLTVLFSAARVSVASSTSSAVPQVLAVSSIPDFDKKSDPIQGLEHLALKIFDQRAPVIRESKAGDSSTNGTTPEWLDDGTFENVIGLLLPGAADASVSEVLLVEWANRKDMLESLSAVQHFLPGIGAVWHAQMRWLALPRITRNLGGWFTRSGKALRSTVVKGLMVGMAALFCVYIFCLPSDFTIEADSTLEPLARNVVFASADGFVESISVVDGQAVKKGQSLVQLSSPNLESQIEETTGQLRAIAEKRNGLRIAINQLKSNSTDSELSQNRMAADILMLDVQEKHAQEKFKYLKQERERLQLISPIDGIVVAKDLHRELNGRPLRRGDALFQIVDLEGEWQLRVLVADRDAGFVQQFYPARQQEVSFQFDSLPGEIFQGKVTFISSSVESVPGKMSAVPTYIQIDPSTAAKAYMGANARVYFQCGKQPLWYVWCRPLVETVQRSVWLFDFRMGSSGTGASS